MDRDFALAEDRYYAHQERMAEVAMWEGRPVEVDYDALEEAHEKAVQEKIQNDVIEVMANANASRYHTLNWLINRVLHGPLDELAERRDDLLKVVEQEASEYVERA